MTAAPILRGALAGMLAFGLFGLLFGKLAGALTPDEWSLNALNAAGLVAITIDAAVGGLAGAWQASRAGARGLAVVLAAALGPLIGALLIVANEPDASLWTVSGLLLITAAAAAAGYAWLARGRRVAY